MEKTETAVEEKKAEIVKLPEPEQQVLVYQYMVYLAEVEEPELVRDTRTLAEIRKAIHDTKKDKKGDGFVTFATAFLDAGMIAGVALDLRPTLEAEARARDEAEEREEEAREEAEEKDHDTRPSAPRRGLKTL